ncbi:hypothetical protein [Companilactobacillus zhongbaensis]|uniref:hypothetical protein n=1 Tax=Companilactobacillus zhongbaensis TaxID=2486009 RepID=UPI0013DE1B7C|nr:hypothetical protein [Companilactobacillus zhongbaensis]
MKSGIYWKPRNGATIPYTAINTSKDKYRAHPPRKIFITNLGSGGWKEFAVRCEIILSDLSLRIRLVFEIVEVNFFEELKSTSTPFHSAIPGTPQNRQ